MTEAGTLPGARSNTAAIAGLAVAIVGAVVFFLGSVADALWPVGAAIALVGVVLGFAGLRRAREGAPHRGIALAAVILGALIVAWLIVFLILAAAGVVD